MITGAIVLVRLPALIAYLNFPLVQLLQRLLPQALAIDMAHLLVVSILAFVMFTVISSFIRQSSAFMHAIGFLSSPAGEHQIQSVIDVLGKAGITREQISKLENQLPAQVQVHSQRCLLS